MLRIPLPLPLLLLLTWFPCACQGPASAAGPGGPSPSASAQELEAAPGWKGFRGRVVDGQGRPVVGAEVAAQRWPAGPSLVERHGSPEWQKAKTQTDWDGRFKLALEHHPAAEYRVEVRGEAGQQVVRNVEASASPGSLLFQDIELRDTATLSAVLEFASETHEDSDWRVKYRRIEVGQGFNYPDAIDADLRRREGAFVAENLTPGIYEVRAEGPLDDKTPWVSHEFTAGETKTIRLPIGGESRAHLAVFSFNTPNPLDVPLPAEAITFERSTGREVAILSREPVNHDVQLNGVFDVFTVDLGRDESVVLSFDHPDFRPFKAKLRAGDSHAFRLIPSGELEFDLPESAIRSGLGDPDRKVELRMTYPAEFDRRRDRHGLFLSTSSTLGQLLEAGSAGFYRRPGRLLVQIDGLAPFEVEVPEWGERRSLRLPLAQVDPVALEGRLVWPDGRPARGAVGLYRQSDVSPNLLTTDPPWSAVLPLDKAIAGEDGSFEFQGLATGDYALQVEASSSWIHWEPRVAAGKGLQTITIPKAPILRGVVRLPEGASRVLKCRRKTAYEIGDHYPAMSQTEELGYPRLLQVEGPLAEFEFEAVAPGSYELRLGGDPESVSYRPLGTLLESVDVDERDILGLELDGTELLDANLTVRLNTDPSDDNPLKVSILRVPLDGEEPPGPWAREGDLQSAWDSTLESGRQRSVFHGVTPGKWLLRIGSTSMRSDSWTWIHPSTIELRPGESKAVDVHVPLVLGQLRLVTEEGEPLVDRTNTLVGSRMRIDDPRWQNFTSYKTPKSLPWMPMSLPEGDHTLLVILKDRESPENPEGRHLIDFSWPPADGETLTLSLADARVPEPSGQR